MTSIVDCILIYNWPNYEIKFTNRERKKVQLTKSFLEEFSKMMMEIDPVKPEKIQFYEKG